MPLLVLLRSQWRDMHRTTGWSLSLTRRIAPSCNRGRSEIRAVAGKTWDEWWDRFARPVLPEQLAPYIVLEIAVRPVVVARRWSESSVRAIDFHAHDLTGSPMIL